MKSVIVKAVVLFALAFSLSTAYAQEVAFGVKGGLNFSNLKMDDVESSSRAGFHAGIFVRGKFNKFAVQPEVLFSTLENKIEYSGGLGSLENSFTYVTVPVMLKFYVVSGLNLQAGPQFSFLVDGDQKFETLIASGKRDITDAYKKSDVSLSLGGGFDFGFGLNIDLRYNLGLTDINEMEDGDEVKSRVIMVSLGWNFMK
jgi:hypothetical protein